MAHPSYYHEGKKLPSVTTILGKFKEPGALMWWSWNVAYEVLCEAHSLVENNAKTTKPAEYLRRKQAYLKSKPLDRGNFRKVSEAACDAGTISHEYISEWILYQHISEPFIDHLSIRDIMVKYKCSKSIAQAALNGIFAFRDWIRQNNFKLEITETSLVSAEHLYGGTLDCIGSLNGKRVIFDWKTSKAVYVDYLCQIAAYEILWEEAYPDKLIQAAHLLRFDKVTADFTEHRFTDLSEGKEMFLLLRRCYDLQKSLEQRVK